MKNPRMPSQQASLPGIGHNSIHASSEAKKTSYDGKYVPPVLRCLGDYDLAFRRFERDIARRERIRYIREGRIIPSFRMPPQMMVLKDGVWKPEIKICYA